MWKFGCFGREVLPSYAAVPILDFVEVEWQVLFGTVSFYKFHPPNFWLQAILGRKHCPSLSREIGSKNRLTLVEHVLAMPKRVGRQALCDHLPTKLRVLFSDVPHLSGMHLANRGTFENSKKRDDFSKGKGTEGSPNFEEFIEI